MFKIEYNLFTTILDVEVQETKAETLDDAETMAIIGCCLRMDLANVKICHCGDLEYGVLLENNVIGRLKITSVDEIEVDSTPLLFKG